MARLRLGCGRARKWQVWLGLVVSSWIVLVVWMNPGRGIWSSSGSYQLQQVVSSSGSNDPSLRVQGVPVPGVSSSGSDDPSSSLPVDECRGKRVFMYDLPAEFNIGLLDRCYLSLVDWLNICPRALNWGFGQLLDFGSVPPESALFSDSFARRGSPASNAEVQSKVWDQDSIAALTADFEAGDENGTCVSRSGGSWFATDFYMLEMIFHKRMLHYRCLTEDPELASLFYLPYYAGLDALQYIFGAKKAQYREHGRGLIEYLEKHPSMSSYWKRHGGSDHFLVAGRLGWDFGRVPGEEGWGTSLYLHPELENVSFLVLENRGEWSRVEQAVPYPTSFHPPLVRRRDGSQDRRGGWGRGELREWKRKVRSSKRKSLFAVAAGRRYPPVREMLLNQCLESNSGHTVSSDALSTDWRGRSFDPVCELVNCSKIQCGHNPQPVADTFLHSEFCLQPAGDGPTRRSTFDSIISGCIPVFFTPASAYTQYTWHLPEDRESYSVFIPEDQVLGQGKKVEDVLRSFTEEQVRRMRDTLMTLLPSVLYLDFVDDSVTSTALCDQSSAQAQPLDQADEDDLMEDAFDIAVKGLLAKVDYYKAQLG